MLSFRVQSLLFYILPIAYFWLVTFSHVGDFQHGGTFIEWVGLQVLAVVVLLGVWALFIQVSKVEKGVLLLCAIYPVIGLVHTALSIVHGHGL